MCEKENPESNFQDSGLFFVTNLFDYLITIIFLTWLKSSVSRL